MNLLREKMSQYKSNVFPEQAMKVLHDIKFAERRTACCTSGLITSSI